MYKGKDFKHNRRPQKKYNEERQLQGLKVEVRNNDITKALRVLKKRMQNEGIFNELRERTFFRKKSENKSKIFRRSIFTTKDIQKGEKFTKDNIRVVRPSYGLPPKYYNKILDKKSPLDIKKQEPLKLMILKKLKIDF